MTKAFMHPASTSPTTSEPVQVWQQWRCLVSAEFKLLQRNLAQLVYALIFPLLIPFLTLPYLPADELPPSVRAQVLGALLAGSIIVGCTMASYYTAVSALVNRREEAVLQRMRAGEIGDTTIIASICTPGALLALLTSTIIFAILKGMVNIHVGPNVWLVAIGTVLALLVCIAFALITANYTRTAESAQITAVPFMLIAMAGVGATLVTKEMSQVLYWILNTLPSAPAAHLIRQGVSLQVDWYIVGRSLALSVAWVVVAGASGWMNLRWARRS